MWEREEITREKAKGTECGNSKRVRTLRIIIPQTIRSVIRIYLLWRGSINREDKKKKKRERQEIRYLPVMRFSGAEIASFEFSRARYERSGEAKSGRERSKYICENERERMKNLYTTGERERESVKQRA